MIDVTALPSHCEFLYILSVPRLHGSLIESDNLLGREPRAVQGEATRRAIRSTGAATLARDLA